MKLLNLNKQLKNILKNKIKNISDILIIPKFLDICYQNLQKDKRIYLKKLNNNLLKKLINNLKNGNFTFSKSKTKNVTRNTNEVISIFSIEFLILQKAIQYLLEIIYQKWFKINWKNAKIEKNHYLFFKQIYPILIKNSLFMEGKINNNYLDNYNYLLRKIQNIIKDQIFIDLIYKILKIKNLEKSSNLILLNIFLYNFDYDILKILKENKNIINFNYIRFNNNFIIGINTTKSNYKILTNNICSVLKNKKNLKLNINSKKINFLGYIIYLKKNANPYLHNTFKLKIKAPIEKIIIKLFLNGFCKKTSTPTSCGKLIHKSLYEIIIEYLILQQKICHYYLITINYLIFSNRIHYILKYSCALTFASKLKLNTLKKIFKKFGKNLTIYFNKQKFIKIFFIKPNFKDSKII